MRGTPGGLAEGLACRGLSGQMDALSPGAASRLSEQFLHALISAELTERYNQWLDVVVDTDHSHGQFDPPAPLSMTAKSD